jgi:hypothetical protein
LKNISEKLTEEFGQGFDERNLRRMRQFYLTFQKWDSLSPELSWTHYRHLLRVENEKARLWYLQEAIKENWSTRALERQINSLYYERLLSSQNKVPVIEEAKENTKELMPQDILQLQPQQLVGEWTVEKWEYWFRSSGLSPAVQELAQQGLMAGQINAESVFMIPQRYEQLLTQLRHVLEDALKAEWPQTRFDVKYAEVETITPYTMQAQRKQKAFQRAHELLQNEDTVKGLVQTFDGELHNIQLK